MKPRDNGRDVEFKKVPIFSATRSLDVRYSFQGTHENAFVTVPGAHIHACLYAGLDGLLQTRNSLISRKSNKPVYKESIDSVNFVTSAITFLTTDTNPEEGYLGEEIQQHTFFISVSGKTNRILSCGDFYTEKKLQKDVTHSKAARDTSFNSLLNQRIHTLSQFSGFYDLPTNIVATPEGLDQSIRSPMFHESFHHSEQAEFHYLSCALGLNDLIKQVLDTKAAYVYGIVLDIFTQRMICLNCNGSAIGLQHSHQSGFLHDLSSGLIRNRVQPRTNLMLNLRVSAKQGAKSSAPMDALRLPQDEKGVHDYNADALPIVFQSENKTLGTQRIIADEKLTLASYPGTFFVSSKFSKSKLEKAIKVLRRR